MKKNKEVVLNEIEVNGVVYVPKNSIQRQYKLYEEIKWKGLDWIVIDLDNENIRLLLKDVIPRNILEEIIEDKWYLANSSDVIMSDNIRAPFNFEKSYIKTHILMNFLDYIDKNGTIEDYNNIDLLSKEEVESLPEEVRKCNDWYWTKISYESDSKYALVWSVNSSGNLSYINADNGGGVRPAVSLTLESFNLES